VANSSERELAKALKELTKAVSSQTQATKKQERAQSGGALGKLLPSGRAQGFGGGFGQGVGLTGLKKRVAGAGGARAFAGQLAGRAALGAGAGLAAGGIAIGAKLAGAGISAAAKGQDISAGVAFAGDQLARHVPFFGEGANKRVATTEGVISDLNALTGDLAALGVNTDKIRAAAAPIFREQQERRYDDQNRNADVARLQVEDQTIIGQIGRSMGELWATSSLHGAK